MKKSFNYTQEELTLLETKIGLRSLFSSKKVNVDKALRTVKYEAKVKELQTELIKLQNWVVKEKKKVIVLFEGRDAAGKTGAIRRITSHINPRMYRIIALSTPTEEEDGQWYFQRYVNHLPKPGELVFFDRSWYNRAVVEPVNGFCTQEKYEIFMDQVNKFEKMIQQSGAILIKLYFSISKEEQEYRFEEMRVNPLKKWKLTPVDLRAQELWDEYTDYKQKMFAHTNTENAPWIIIDANKKTEARLQALNHLVDTIPYVAEEDMFDPIPVFE